jgi:hypothetical protein
MADPHAGAKNRFVSSDTAQPENDDAGLPKTLLFFFRVNADIPRDHIPVERLLIAGLLKQHFGHAQLLFLEDAFVLDVIGNKVVGVIAASDGGRI